VWSSFAIAATVAYSAFDAALACSRTESSAAKRCISSPTFVGRPVVLDCDHRYTNRAPGRSRFTPQARYRTPRIHACYRTWLTLPG
jgi:hypothetical protein